MQSLTLAYEANIGQRYVTNGKQKTFLPIRRSSHRRTREHYEVNEVGDHSSGNEEWKDYFVDRPLQRCQIQRSIINRMQWKGGTIWNAFGLFPIVYAVNKNVPI